MYCWVSKYSTYKPLRKSNKLHLLFRFSCIIWRSSNFVLFGVKYIAVFIKLRLNNSYTMWVQKTFFATWHIVHVKMDSIALMKNIRHCMIVQLTIVDLLILIISLCIGSYGRDLTGNFCSINNADHFALLLLSKNTG